MRNLMTIVLFILAAYVLICAAVFAFQSRLVYFPERSLIATPAHGGMDYQDVYFESDDGVMLHGWFVPTEEAIGTVLFCHGNGGNISHRVESLRVFHDLGLASFIFDYRGYGQSGGKIGEAGTYRDAHAARRYLVEEVGVRDDEIIFFGRSLGGAVAIELATHFGPRAVIVESCFPSIADIGSRVYPWLPVRPLSRIRYDSRDRVARLTCPKLIIHSRDDEIVPFDLGRRLFALAAEPKQFLEIRGDHNAGFLISGSHYVGGLRAFLESLGMAGGGIE
jgi:fermentation-respiration switch protein FrsA (DUF1100 family)